MVSSRDRSPIRARQVDLAVVLIDIALIWGIAGVVVGLHLFGSAPLKASLTHEIGRTTPLSMIGHAFVHYSTVGLITNVSGYLTLATVGYLLGAAIGEREWTLLSLAAILTIVPLMTGLADEVVFRAIAPETTVSIRGLSAVVASVAGLVYVVYLGFLRRLYDAGVVAIVGTGMAIAAMGAITSIHAAELTVQTALPAVLAVLLVAFEGGRRLVRTDDPVRREHLLLAIAVGGIVATLQVVAAAVLFPTDLFATGSFTNIYGHAVGWGLGLVITLWGHRYWTSVSWFG